MNITVTLIICVITGLVSYQAFNNRELFYKFMHFPYQEHRNKGYFRWVTACLLHADWIHLFINLFVFYQFGMVVEYYFVELFGVGLGRFHFLLLYVLSGVFANSMTYARQKENQSFTSVGASGAVSGIMLAYVIFGPWEWLLLFFVIPIPAFLAAGLYLFYSSYAAKKQHGSRIDHEAHFWGAVFGLVYTVAIKPSLFLRFIELLFQPQIPF